MTAGNLVRRSLRFRWRSQLGILLGTTTATLILVGALAVGDSVRHSLARQALLRLGQVHFVVNTHDRFFREQLAAELAAELQAPVAPVIASPGLFTTADGRRRVNQLQVIGADARFRALTTNGTEVSPAGNPAWLPQGTAWGNPEFVRRVRAADAPPGSSGLPPGGIVRLEKPAWLPRDAPASSTTDAAAALRVTLAEGEGPERFSLQASQIVPPNVAVALSWLQRELAQPARANVLLIGQNAAGSLTAEQVNAALRRVWTLADADLALAEVPGPAPSVELRTDRVFLEAPITAAALAAARPSQEVLTYFVNSFRAGDRSTPYSFVAATDGLADRLPPADRRPLGDDEILLNAWLAEDLRAKVGDTVTLAFFVTGTGRTLDERTAAFRVRGIVPVEPADERLTPKIPGLSDKENCREWDPGTSIQLDRIRPQDEAYWEKHRGTPKAYVSLAAGTRLWQTRFGDRTALRWSGQDTAKLAAGIRAALDPAQVGLFAQPIRSQALRAAAESQDFGGLFLGLSFFLIVAALLLTGLLFAFGVEQRGTEIGTLLAVGWTGPAVRRLFLREGLALAAVGGMIGTVAGLAYTRLVLLALLLPWRGAVAGAELWFHAEPTTLAIGGASGVIIAGAVIWFVLRRAARRPARALLAGEPALAEPAAGTPRSARRATVIALGAAALGLALLVRGFRGEHAAADFFGAGALLLIGGLAGSAALLRRLEQGTGAVRHAAALARQNVARRRGRSLATVALLACGSFLVIAVGANRHDPAADAARPSSGTGGFTFFGETPQPVPEDLGTPAGRENLGLPRLGLENVRVVSLRLREGDDASCLNLNRAQMPRLLAVDPREFASRGAFSFLHSAAGGSENPWLQLERAAADGALPAIGDEATVRWALGRKVGETLDYTDDRGRTFPIRIVGMIGNSVLQGSLIVAERQFVARFPGESGQRVFLVDTPAATRREVAETLTRALRDYGLELQPTGDRLARFQQVENTYLTIFQALGGLGLILGSVGLGVVVLRNALERRSELALLRAVGFTRTRLLRLLILEHAGLLLLGLACGVVAALVAVAPALRGSPSQVPYGSLALTLAVLVLSGLVWIWLAALLALRGSLLRSLRRE
jgi:putative ABC transport system permease protein